MPRAGVLDIAPYVPGRSKATGGSQAAQALVERDAARARARRRSRPIRAAADRLASLPRRLGHGAPRGDRRGLRAQPRSHRLRRRLGRDPDLIAAGLYRARRRGDLHRARLSRLSDRHQGGGRHAGGRAGEGPDGGRRRDPGAGERARRASSSSPIPTTRPAPICRSARSAACMPACRRRRSSSSTRPMPNMSGATTTRAASSSRPPPTTW